jgi:hypothetical protein
MQYKDDAARRKAIEIYAQVPYTKPQKIAGLFESRKYGQAIKDILKERDISQGEISRCTGLSQVLLSNMLNGKQLYPLVFYQWIAESLRVPLQDILDRGDKYTRSTLPEVEQLTDGLHKGRRRKNNL